MATKKRALRKVPSTSDVKRAKRVAAAKPGNAAAYKRVAQLLDEQAESLRNADANLYYDLSIAAAALRKLVQPEPRSTQRLQDIDKRNQCIAFIDALLQERNRWLKKRCTSELSAVLGTPGKPFSTSVINADCRGAYGKNCIARLRSADAKLFTTLSLRNCAALFTKEQCSKIAVLLGLGPQNRSYLGL